jgi:CxxC-x17-CxxC domain-containing protein
MEFKKGRSFGNNGASKQRRDARSPGFTRRPAEFGKSDSGRERKPFAKKEFGRGKFELFDATCGKCGKACQVPFRPTSGGKPVLCRDCFKAAPREFSPRAPASAPSGELREINRKLDKIMQALKIE